jgi:hypothetical protein
MQVLAVERSQNVTVPGVTGVPAETTVAVSVTAVPGLTEVTGDPALVTSRVVCEVAAAEAVVLRTSLDRTRSVASPNATLAKAGEAVTRIMDVSLLRQPAPALGPVETENRLSITLFRTVWSANTRPYFD